MVWKVTLPEIPTTPMTSPVRTSTFTRTLNPRPKKALVAPGTHQGRASGGLASEVGAGVGAMMDMAGSVAGDGMTWVRCGSGAPRCGGTPCGWVAYTWVACVGRLRGSRSWVAYAWIPCGSRANGVCQGAAASDRPATDSSAASQSAEAAVQPKMPPWAVIMASPASWNSGK